MSRSNQFSQPCSTWRCFSALAPLKKNQKYFWNRMIKTKFHKIMFSHKKIKTFYLIISLSNFGLDRCRHFLHWMQGRRLRWKLLHVRQQQMHELPFRLRDLHRRKMQGLVEDKCCWINCILIDTLFTIWNDVDCCVHRLFWYTFLRSACQIWMLTNV